MSSLEYPFVIGTAGHIDHGKTAIVQALSGVDTDRLSEEKRRGMTIELGFAPLTLPSGRTISIIDVPGHEKFIRQMVAGAAGADAVMLVVAADDGVMPQTREHLEILSLLDVKNGITVINKIDLVDPEMLAVAEDDVRTLTMGTFLEDKPLVKVSAFTGEGIGELTQEIENIVASGEQRARDGAYFLPVDRVFHISGFGTVVTGTSVKGTLHEGDDLDILPHGGTAKVRSIQVHNESVESATAGLRTAVNLAGVALEEIKRGDVVAAEGRYARTSCIDVRLEVPASFSGSVEHWQRVRLHVGTSDVVARISLLEGESLAPGECAMAQIITEEPVATYSGAHFIIRSYSPLHTIAGGKVLFPLGERPKNKMDKLHLLDFMRMLSWAKDLKDRVSAIINYKENILHTELVLYSEAEGTPLASALGYLSMKERIAHVKTGEPRYLSRAAIGAYLAKITDLLEAYHKEHPELKGMEAEEIARGLQTPDTKFVREAIAYFVAHGMLTQDGEKTRLNGFKPFDEESFMVHVGELRSLARKCGYAMPTIEEAESLLNIEKKDMQRAVNYLKERKEAAIVGDEFLVFDFLENDLREKLASLDGDLTLAAVRDVTNSSRKYILPLLEHFDTKGITRRVADKRILLKK